MIQKLGPFLGIVMFVAALPSHAQCLDEKQCKAPFLRVQLDENLVSQKNAEVLSPWVDQLFTPHKKLPANFSSLSREKQRELLNAPDQLLNSSMIVNKLNNQVYRLEQVSLPSDVKLPCKIVMGNLGSKCGSLTDVQPTSLIFSQPLSLTNIEIDKPTSKRSLSFNKDRLEICVDIKKLSLNLGVELSLTLPDSNETLAVNDIKLELDQKKTVCISANKDLSEFKIINTQDTFVSSDMIQKAADGVTVKTNSFNEEQVGKIRGLAKRFLLPMVPGVEKAVQDSLADVIGKEIKKFASPLVAAQDDTSLFIPRQGYAGEIGLVNVMAQNQLDRVECALQHELGIATLAHVHFKDIVESPLGILEDAANSKDVGAAHLKSSTHQLILLKGIIEEKNLTSPSVIRRLIALKPLIMKKGHPGIDPSKCEAKLDEIQKDICYKIEKIKTEAWEDRLKDDTDRIDKIVEQANINATTLAQAARMGGQFAEINTKFGDGTELTVSLTDYCNAPTTTSRIPPTFSDCPIQIAMDLNQLNALIQDMWNSGQLCMTGKGTNCGLEFGGAKCSLLEAPQFVQRGQMMGISTLKLKQCMHPSAAGSSGDFTFTEILFKPSVCGNNGDLCLDPNNSNGDFKIDKGVGLMDPNTFFGKLVIGEAKKQLKTALGNVIRIPLAASAKSGPLSNFPLELKSIDKNPAIKDGFLGVCLQPAVRPRK